MARALASGATALAALGGAGCTAPATGPAEAAARAFGRTDVIVVDRDVVGVLAEMPRGGSRDAVSDYARCVLAGYAQARGLGFARHLRTRAIEAGGVWRADALYSVSPALPEGLARIDTEVTVADCAERGVPVS